MKFIIPTITHQIEAQISSHKTTKSHNYLKSTYIQKLIMT